MMFSCPLVTFFKFDNLLAPSHLCHYWTTVTWKNGKYNGPFIKAFVSHILTEKDDLVTLLCSVQDIIILQKNMISPHFKKVSPL